MQFHELTCSSISFSEQLTRTSQCLFVRISIFYFDISASVLSAAGAGMWDVGFKADIARDFKRLCARETPHVRVATARTVP